MNTPLNIKTKEKELSRVFLRRFKELLWDFFDGAYATGLAGREIWKTDEDYNRHLDDWIKRNFKPLFKKYIK